MATTFLKRQKEMKRLEKQREKAERRAQRKLTGGTGNEISDDNSDVFSATIPHSLTWLNLTSQSRCETSDGPFGTRTSVALQVPTETGLTEIVELLRGYGATK